MRRCSITRVTVAVLALCMSTLACAGRQLVGVGSVTAVTSTFLSIGDAYVDASTPSRNYGASSQLAVGDSPVQRTFIKFAISGLVGPVVSATLRLHVSDGSKNGSSSGGAVSRVADTGWSEMGIVYANQPAISGATLATLGAVSAGSWYELDVTSAIHGNGIHSFAVTSKSSDDAGFDSRETGANGPKLVVTTNSAAQPTPPSTGSVLVGAGDISSCANNNDEATAKLLDTISGTVFTAGDAAYNDGSASNFSDCYNPTWGRHKARTRPVPGNHEYHTAGASAYFDYFGASAGNPGRGYYSYDLGDWHVVGINSNCAYIGGCQAGSTQEQWLRADLAPSKKSCTIAFWHHALFTSGAKHPPATEMQPIFQALYDHNAELVVTGHNHQYERFAPQTPSGALDNVRGIRAFVVGTGGAGLYSFGTAQPNSQVRNATSHGVLKFTLKSRGYNWNFIPVEGKTFTDSGSGTCH